MIQHLRKSYIKEANIDKKTESNGKRGYAERTTCLKNYHSYPQTKGKVF